MSPALCGLELLTHSTGSSAEWPGLGKVNLQLSSEQVAYRQFLQLGSLHFLPFACKWRKKIIIIYIHIYMNSSYTSKQQFTVKCSVVYFNLASAIGWWDSFMRGLWPEKLRFPKYSSRNSASIETEGTSVLQARFLTQAFLDINVVFVQHGMDGCLSSFIGIECWYQLVPVVYQWHKAGAHQCT